MRGAITSTSLLRLYRANAQVRRLTQVDQELSLQGASGHSGAAAGGETHYNVLIVSAAFATMTRVQRSRAVHETVAHELGTGLHALSLTLRTPEEQSVKNSSQN